MTASTERVALTIGQVARRTGVPVRTVRFWSDEGLVEAGRTANRHRMYDAAAVARLDLVRTLRELGVGLDDIRTVLTQQRGIADVAAAHVHALDGQIRALRAQRAVCAVIAGAATTTDRSVPLMNDLARMSAAERQAVIDAFVADVLTGADADPTGGRIADGMRTMPSELPSDPTSDQVAAWVELAELVGDPAFRERCREMFRAGADNSARGWQPDANAVVDHAGAAQAAGVDPSSPEARAVLAEIPGVADLDAAARRGVADTVETFTDRRVERYWHLLAILNGWTPREPAAPAFEWFAQALRSAPSNVP